MRCSFEYQSDEHDGFRASHRHCFEIRLALFSSHRDSHSQVCFLQRPGRGSEGAEVERMGALVPRSGSLVPVKSYPAYTASGMTGL